jgi:hypothetical protein
LERPTALLSGRRDDRVAHAKRIGDERPEQRLVVRAGALLQRVPEQRVAKVAVAEGLRRDAPNAALRQIDSEPRHVEATNGIRWIDGPVVAGHAWEAGAMRDEVTDCDFRPRRTRKIERLKQHPDRLVEGDLALSDQPRQHQSGQRLRQRPDLEQRVRPGGAYDKQPALPMLRDGNGDATTRPWRKSPGAPNTIQVAQERGFDAGGIDGRARGQSRQYRDREWPPDRIQEQRPDDADHDVQDRDRHHDSGHDGRDLRR